METNTKKIEELYGKQIAEWDVSDFNTIAQLRPDVAELFDVETCRENAAREDLPAGVKKIFLGYILIIAFKDANDLVDAKLQEWSKEFEKSETPVTNILAKLDELLLDKNESDYARLRAVNTALAYWSVQDDAKTRCKLNEHVDVIKYLLGAILDDLEFMGVRMFLIYTIQYIDLLFSTGAFYHQVYNVDILEEYNGRLEKINEEYAAIMKEMEDVILSNPDLMKQLDDVNPEDLGMPDIFKDEEDKNEDKETGSRGEADKPV